MNCLDCKKHAIIHDPDPDDWFCSDDMAVVCKLEKTVARPESRYASDRSHFKRVAVSVRPYNLRKESKTPEWCPLHLGQGG